MYARPKVEGEPATLGVSGKLWRDSLIMYDRATGSLWSQLNGEAVAGPLKGQRLAPVPSELTTWADWKRRYPDTLVLVKPRLSGSSYQDYHDNPARIGVLGTQNPDPRLPGKELVLGLERNGKFTAIPIAQLKRARVTNVSTLGAPIVIFTSGNGASARAYDRTVGGKTLTFEPANSGRIRDRETATIWSWEEGKALQGPLSGAALVPIKAFPVYWGVWVQFHPTTQLIAKLR